MKRTAISYDPFNKRHTREGHPENFRRLDETWNLLQIDGILHQVSMTPSTPAPRAAVLRVHSPAYLDRLESVTLFGGGHLDADTYLTHDSFDAAMLAVGGVLNVTDRVLRGQMDNGFALVRPPGHHALAHTGMGFCLLDNVAIAARWAQDTHGLNRILIVDFDVHHGNGTQDIFYQDPSVLFFSVHQFPFYPGTGAATEIGLGRAERANINVPLPASVGDEGYLATFEQILIPAARLFRPELILVSAGYDAHWMDPLAHMRLSITGYGRLITALMELASELCHGRLVAVLEGGYHVNVLSHCVLTTLRTLSGTRQVPSDPYGPAPGGERDIAPLLERLKALHHISDPPFFSLPR